MTFIRDRISREEGVAAVEFALILPVLALLLFGILEFGRVWSQYQVFQGAAREGARCAAVQATEFSDCEIQPAIDQAAAPYDPKRCSSQAGGANELSEYIEQMGLEGSIALQAALWDPPPTYVCAAGGVPNRLVQEIVAWLNATADLTPTPIVDFPVVACDGNAPPCYPWSKTGGRDAYPVIDFAGFSVVQAWSGNAAQRNPNCEFERNSSDVFCIQLKVADPGAPRLHNAVVVRLVG